MTSRLCTVAAAISLVACVATGWLWVKSYRAGVSGRGRLILNFGNQMWMVRCDSGHVAVLRSPDLVKATQDDLQVCANARSMRNDDLSLAGSPPGSGARERADFVERARRAGCA